MKRKIEITYKEEEMISVKTRRIFKGYCEQCEMTVEVLTLETVALLLGLSEADIPWLLEAGNIHLVGSKGDYICRNSLESFLEILKNDSEV